MLKKFVRIILLLFILTLVGIFSANYYIEKKTEAYVYDNLQEVPPTRVGIILGTSKYLIQGGVNAYYKNRIDAAVHLFRQNKIDFILISGDNSTTDYNEPQTFKNDLIKLGIPENKIFLDYAGFRTLDSVIRANEIFGLDECIIISQKFHNQRAIFLARHHGLHAYGFNAKDVNQRSGFKTNMREKLARVKVFIDIILAKQPKFLGKEIKIK
ncbi:MAG TPA: ElyC/SanA/YdcF family protein [Flavobacteriaceae bacterium]|nr:ElyC/SanA/YdcF family protein [Flavobacteriaceae bacterium]